MKADRFSGPGGEHRKGVATGEHRLNYPALQRTEVLEAVMPVKQASGLGEAFSQGEHGLKL